MKLTDAVRERYKLADLAFEKWLGSPRCGRAVSCAAGCSACCELLLLVTWPEAAVIAEDLVKLGRVDEFLAALQDQARAASYADLDADTYWRREIPCAFLRPRAEGGRVCALYDSRPGNCRWHVAFSPAEACGIRPSSKMMQSDAGEMIRVALVPLLHDLAKHIGREAYEAAPLPVMVLAALQELRPSVIVPVTPRQWLDRHGEHVWAYHRKEKRNRKVAP